MSLLNVLTGIKSGTNIPLISDTMVLGRMASCDIVLPDHTVSRHHARIVRQEHGFYIEDLQSRNGTYVNGRRITEPTRLTDRDQIQLYDITLTYREEAGSLSRSAGSSRITPEPWSASDLERESDRDLQTETVAEMDVAYRDDERPQNSAEVKLQLILEITRCLESPFDREQMLSRLLDRLAGIFPQFDRGYILLADESLQRLRPVAIRHRDDSRLDPLTIRPVTRSIARQVLTEGKAVLSVDKVAPEHREAVLDFEYRSIMCAPLIGATRKPLGIVYVDSANVHRRFTPDDLNILTCVAILAGQALEQEYQHSARYRAVVDTAVDGIITVNARGNIESVNPAVEQLFGWSRNELIGQTLDTLIPESETFQLSSLAEIRGGTNNGADREVVARKKDGSYFPIHLSLGRFELGGKKYFTGILHDISERKRAEASLKQSQQELKDFVENAVIGLHWISPEGLILWANRAELDLLGYDRHEYIGRHCWDFHADQKTAEAIWKKLASGQELRNHPARLRCRNGAIKDVLISSTIFRRNGQIAQYRCFTRDVTEKKKAEEALRTLNENLEQQVRERTQSVRLLQDIAVIANEAETVNQAVREVLDRISNFMDWPVGHAWFADPQDPETFIDSGLWSHPSSCALESLKQISHETRLRVGEGLVGSVARSCKPHWVENPDEDSLFTRARELTDSSLNFVLAFPVHLGEQVVAVLEFFARETQEPSADLLELMKNVGTQLSRVVERRRLQEELIDAVWAQQRYFGQELHDTLGQELTGIGMMVNSLSRKLAADGLPAAEKLAEVADMIQQAKTGVRRLAKGLFPVEVDAEGLRAALEDLARMTQERCDIACDFTSSGLVELLDNNVATHLFRIAQEAVNNAVKHSRAERIAINLTSDQEHVELSIADNGKGIDAEQVRRFSGMGLRIMRYRANLIGAAFDIQHAPEGGACISCHLDLRMCTPQGNQIHVHNGTPNASTHR